MIEKDIRTGIFVDAANIYASARSAYSRKINYESLLNFATGNNRLYRAIVYAVKHGESFSGWETALSHIGYEVKSKEPVRYPDGHSKADWDIQVCMDVVRMVDGHCIDMVVIVSGDGDFIPLVQWCQSKGRLVRIIGVDASTSRLLKETADIFTPITFEQLIDEEIKPRPRPTQTSPVSGVQAQAKFGDGLVPSLEEREILDREIEEAEAKRA